MKGFETVQWTSLSVVMVEASSLTLPEMVVILEVGRDSSGLGSVVLDSSALVSAGLVAFWAKAIAGMNSANAIAGRRSLFIGHLFFMDRDSWCWLGILRQEIWESNWKCELEGFKNVGGRGECARCRKIRRDTEAHCL